MQISPPFRADFVFVAIWDIYYIVTEGTYILYELGTTEKGGNRGGIAERTYDWSQKSRVITRSKQSQQGRRSLSKLELGDCRSQEVSDGSYNYGRTTSRATSRGDLRSVVARPVARLVGRLVVRRHHW